MDEQHGGKDRRPYLASECNSLKECEKWRLEIVRDISKKVAQIQNAGLGEFRIRDLNDEINKLMREKGHWEDRIRQLGGPDYRRVGPRMLDHEGKEVPGQRGYRYFGAAKDLPGVRELFQDDSGSEKKKTRGQLFAHVDADYYGYRDEDDGILLPLEEEAEQLSVQQAFLEWKKKQEAANPGKDIEAELRRYAIMEEEDLEERKRAKEEEVVEDIAVPSQEAIEKMLLQRRKELLMQQYASEALLQQEEEAKRLAGRL